MIEKPTQVPKSEELPKKRKRNSEIRSREYLFTDEIRQLRKAARNSGRHGNRDDALVLVMFRHALRVGEAVALRWEQVDLNQGLLQVKRLKNGIPSTHPIRGKELRALRKLQRQYPKSPYVFVSERKAPLTVRAVQLIVSRAGKLAGLPFPIHPHMLRHSLGFYLANNGEDTRAIQCYMGHANIKNTVIYTELSPQRFNDFFDD